MAKPATMCWQSCRNLERLRSPACLIGTRPSNAEKSQYGRRPSSEDNSSRGEQQIVPRTNHQITCYPTKDRATASSPRPEDFSFFPRTLPHLSLETSSAPSCRKLALRYRKICPPPLQAAFSSFRADYYFLDIQSLNRQIRQAIGTTNPARI